MLRFKLQIGLIFCLSGFAGLAYQVVWQRLLALIYGVGSVSTTVVVSVYMLGLGAGAILGGRWADSSQQLQKSYAVLEFGLAVYGLLSIPFIGLLSRTTSNSSIAVAILASAAFLALPTLLMGATLPILVKFYTARSGDYFHSVSLLYFVNTLGAAFGALFTSYILISFAGLMGSLVTAILVNVGLGISVLLLKPHQIDIAARPPSSPSSETLGAWAAPLVVTTGFLALGYEMVWFRVLGTLLKASPYLFPTVLSVYLLGIALGSYGVSKLAIERFGGARELFFLLQGGLAVCAGLPVYLYYYLSGIPAVYALTRRTFDRQVPHPTFTDLDTFQGWFSTLDVFFWPAVFVFVPTLLMGASFPLISWLELKKDGEEGGAIASVYFLMIIGNVLGGIVTGFVLFPWLGTERTLLLFTCIGLSFFFFTRSIFKTKAAAGVAVAILLALNWTYFPKRGSLYLEVMLPAQPPGTRIVFNEGIDSVIISTQVEDSIASYINGMVHGSRSPVFFYETQEALMWSRKLDHVLVFGFGTGSFTEALLTNPDVKKITVVELSQTLIDNLARFEKTRKLLSDPRVTLIVDDGRRYLQRTEEKFDLVLMDPLRSTTALSNNLYSQEFFELVKTRLTPEGVLLVWLDEFRVIPKTLFSVFPEARPYEIFCLLSKSAFERPSRTQQEVIANFPMEFREMMPRLDGYAGDKQQLLPRLEPYPINQDWYPRSEYYLGLRALYGERASAWNLGEEPSIRYRPGKE